MTQFLIYDRVRVINSASAHYGRCGSVTTLNAGDLPPTIKVHLDSIRQASFAGKNVSPARPSVEVDLPLEDLCKTS